MTIMVRDEVTSEVSRRIVAGEDIPPNARTEAIPPSNLHIHLSPENFTSDDDNEVKPLFLMVKNNRLEIEGRSVSQWVAMLPLAEDVEQENAVLTKSDEHRVALVITKAVKKGDAIRIWFLSDLASQLDLPFLNFSHIKDNYYVCPICHRKFKTPNPLKLHLSNSCLNHPSKTFWQRMKSSCMKSSASSTWSSPFILDSHLEYHQLSMGWKNPTYPFMMNTLLHPGFRQPNYTLKQNASISSCDSKLGGNNDFDKKDKNEHVSAFKPFSSNKHAPEAIRHQQVFSSSQPILKVSENCKGVFQINPTSICDQVPQNVPPILPRSDPSDHFAEVEALVSNLGKGQGGHICLYCGKVYSRKYGLKIHIRTHTGYKPLSCHVCHRAFGDPSNLNKHVRLHAEGTSPYRCPHCGKVLVRRRDLARHLSSRHPDKPSLGLAGEEDTEEEQLDVVKVSS